MGVIPGDRRTGSEKKTPEVLVRQGLPASRRGGTPGRIRTPNLLIRSQVPYPIRPRARVCTRCVRRSVGANRFPASSIPGNGAAGIRIRAARGHYGGNEAFLQAFFFGSSSSAVFRERFAGFRFSTFWLKGKDCCRKLMGHDRIGEGSREHPRGGSRKGQRKGRGKNPPVC